MKLSISNIAWQKENDATVYDLMKKYGYSGLEIAPTRIFPERPYAHQQEAVNWKNNQYKKHGFLISSMQSIWYGRQECLFGTQEERNSLLDYTKEAINFAAKLECKNLVFGCPKNRIKPMNADIDIAVSFFKEIGDYAASKGTAIGIEANPPIYNTNFINTTASALHMIKAVESKGFRLNLDVGTMIHNKESVDVLLGNVNLINHVHISEPGLKLLERRTIHAELKTLLTEEGYHGYISLEMGKIDDLKMLETSLEYVATIFGK